MLKFKYLISTSTYVIIQVHVDSARTFLVCEDPPVFNLLVIANEHCSLTDSIGIVLMNLISYRLLKVELF